MSNAIIIDVQGFKIHNNKFILKEIAVLLNDSEYIRFLLKSPFHYSQLTRQEKTQVQWLQLNHHGLRWEDGSIKYKSAKNFILNHVNCGNIVYVKGIEKKKWVSAFIDYKTKVVNIEADGYSENFEELKQIYASREKCLTHTGICAVENVFLINSYLKST